MNLQFNNHLTDEQTSIRVSYIIRSDQINKCYRLPYFMTDIIDFPLFQRLKNHHHFGNVQFENNATFSVFEHSLRVAYLSLKYFNKIEKNYKKNYENMGFQFGVNNTEQQYQKLKDLVTIAGLCYHLGYPSFQGVLEAVITDLDLQRESCKILKQIMDHFKSQAPINKEKQINGYYELNDMDLIENMIKGVSFNDWKQNQTLKEYPYWVFQIVKNHEISILDAVTLSYIERTYYLLQIKKSPIRIKDIKQSIFNKNTENNIKYYFQYVQEDIDTIKNCLSDIEEKIQEKKKQIDKSITLNISKLSKDKKNFFPIMQLDNQQIYIPKNSIEKIDQSNKEKQNSILDQMYYQSNINNGNNQNIKNSQKIQKQIDKTIQLQVTFQKQSESIQEKEQEETKFNKLSDKNINMINKFEDKKKNDQLLIGDQLSGENMTIINTQSEKDKMTQCVDNIIQLNHNQHQQEQQNQEIQCQQQQIDDYNNEDFYSGQFQDEIYPENIKENNIFRYQNIQFSSN